MHCHPALRHSHARATGPSGGQKRKGETPTGEFGTSSTLSHFSRRDQEMVERCCSCTRNSTCSTTGPSSRACECRNAGRQCTGCYCWGKCRDKGRLMPSPTTTQDLLGIFPRGADLPDNDPSATTPPVRSPTSSSLRAISSTGAGGRSARGGTSGRSGLREEGRSGEGGRPRARNGAGGVTTHRAQRQKRKGGDTTR